MTRPAAAVRGLRLIACVMLLVSGIAHADGRHGGRYVFTAPGATAVNVHQRIVLFSQTCRAGRCRSFAPPPGHAFVSSVAINDEGVILANESDPDGAERPFLFDTRTGIATEIRLPGVQQARGISLNDAGDIVGTATTLHGRLVRAFVVIGGKVTLFAPSDATAKSIYPLFIGPDGTAVGCYYSTNAEWPLGFVYRSGTITTLSAPGAVSGTCATSVDAGGVVTGYADDYGDATGFLYVNDQYTILPDFSFQPLRRSAIGAVIGNQVEGITYEGVLVRDGNSAYRVIYPGASITYATSVDARGDFVGQAIIDTHGAMITTSFIATCPPGQEPCH